MHLDRGQELSLAGERGPAAEWAMEVLVKLGDRAGSSRMVPVSSAHVPGWCEAGPSDACRWLASFADRGTVQLTANPGGPDDDGTRERKRALENWRSRPCYSFTCAPYLSGNHPSRGQVIAWGGRAASAFANSVIGARTEVESFETALASAITGLTPERGLHLEERRRMSVAVTVKKDHGGRIDHSLLGWNISRELDGQTPLLCGISPTFDKAKRLAFAINSRASMPLFGMRREAAPPTGMEAVEVSMDDELFDRPERPDLVVLGCPHLSEQDINRWSRRLADSVPGKAEAWFFTSRLCMDKCPTFGAVLRKRGRVLADQCPLGLVRELAGRVVACDSPSLVECLRRKGVSASYLTEEELESLLVRRD